LLGGDFPDINKLIPECKRSARFLRASLIGAVERFMVCEGELLPRNVVTLAIEPDVITIRKLPTGGEYIEEIAAASDGDLAISFDARLLLESLKNQADDEITLGYTAKTSPCVIRGRNSIAVIGPSNTDAPKQSR
jgi:DNA polymerase III sliding clamp (beta) subunit (PCNA family)